MAFFGAPTSHEDDPERAVRAGLEILEGISEITAEVQRDYGESFNLRIGINTGLAVVGEVGTSAVSEYTAIGDAVNVAARMEQTAQPGNLQISADTQKLLSGSFQYETLGVIDVKGKAEPVDVLHVLGLQFDSGVSRNVAAPLIGRDEELTAITELMHKSREVNGQVVSIIGEAGLGKSRLVSELRNEWIKHEPEITWEFSQGIPYDMGRPYSIFQNLVRGMFGVELTDPRDVIHAKVNGALRAMGGAEEAVNLCIVAVEKIIAAKVLFEAPNFSAEAIKNDVFSVVVPAFVAAENESPRAVIFDDLQWSDETSKELIINKLDYVTGTKTVLILAFRPDPDSPAQEIRDAVQSKVPDKYSEFVIEPLGVDDTNELITELLHIKDIPDAARELVLRKAEGNPYFVEEVVR